MKNIGGKARNIRTSLFGFCVPVILIIALGTGAYYIASVAMVNRYEESQKYYEFNDPVLKFNL